MVKYCELFWSFFKVGTFTIGGGYAMLPLMQREIVDRHGWMDETSFLDCVAFAQAMPGVFAVNVASLTGQRLRGKRGSAVAIAGNIMMPIVFILLLAMFFRAFRDNVYVSRIFLGLRPCVVALIAAPVFTLARKMRIRWQDAWIPVVCALLVWLFGVNPVLVVFAAILIGLIFGGFATKHTS